METNKSIYEKIKENAMKQRERYKNYKIEFSIGDWVLYKNLKNGGPYLCEVCDIWFCNSCIISSIISKEEILLCVKGINLNGDIANFYDDISKFELVCKNDMLITESTFVI